MVNASATSDRAGAPPTKRLSRSVITHPAQRDPRRPQPRPALSLRRGYPRDAPPWTRRSPPAWPRAAHALRRRGRVLLQTRLRLTDLETEVENLFACGGGAGVTRGLIQASAAGLVAAQAIRNDRSISSWGKMKTAVLPTPVQGARPGAGDAVGAGDFPQSPALAWTTERCARP